MIIYTCPKCGGDIYHTCICTFPPIDVWACVNPECGWRREKGRRIERRKFDIDEDWTTYENIENVMLNG